MLGSGESDSSASSDEVCVGPLSVPHLLWCGTVWNKDNLQILAKCLLDDGAHFALIRPEWLLI